jgi:hypothetical protein
MAKTVPDPLKFKMTPQQAATLQLYRGLMEEVKIRLLAIDSAGSGKTGLPGQIVREFCFLQLRMLCELIALASLVAHGDITSNTKLVEEWRAGLIVNKLEGLHAQFFPRPVSVAQRPDPLPNEMITNWKGCLTKDELVTLNGLSGDALHRGSLKKLISPKNAPTQHLNDVREWATKIGNLLSSHAIITLDKKSVIACVLWNRQDDLNVKAQFALAIGPEDEHEFGPVEDPSEN